MVIAKPQLQCPYWNLKALNRNLELEGGEVLSVEEQEGTDTW